MKKKKKKIKKKSATSKIKSAYIFLRNLNGRLLKLREGELS